MKNKIEKNEEIIENKKEGLDIVQSKEENLDLYNHYLNYRNKTNNDKKLIIDYFQQINEREKLDENSINSLYFEKANSEFEDLISENKKLSKLFQEEYKNKDLVAFNGNLLLDYSEVDLTKKFELINKLDEVKNKLKIWKRFFSKEIYNLKEKNQNLIQRKKELEDLLSNLNKKFVLIRLFKKDEINNLKQEILKLDNEISKNKLLVRELENKEGKLNEVIINNKINYELEGNTSIDENILNIKSRIKNLEAIAIDDRSIENINEHYIEVNILPYLYNYDGNKDYKSQMDKISVPEKEIYLEVYKKYFSLHRGAHNEFSNLSSDEIESKKEELAIFNKVENQLKKTYQKENKFRQFELYQVNKNESFNNELKKIFKIIFSEFYNLEKKSNYLDLKKKLNLADKDFHYSISEDEISLDSFYDIDKLYPYIKNFLKKSKIIKEENIEQIEDSLIEKLFKKYVLTEKVQGNEGQAAFGFMNSINSYKSIPYFIDYIKNKKHGDTRSICLNYLFNVSKSLPDNKKNEILKNLDKDDSLLIEKLIDENSYLSKNIEKEKHSPRAFDIIGNFLRSPDVFKLQEKIVDFLEKNNKSEDNISDFYKLTSYNVVDFLLKYIEHSGENKEEVLKKYQNFYIKNNIDIINFLSITKLLNNYDEISELLIKRNNFTLLFNNEIIKEIGYKKLAYKLIENDRIEVLVYYLDKFKDLDHNEIFEKAIKSENKEAVIENLGKFRNLKEKYAITLIEEGKIDEVANNLSSFNNISRSTGKILLESLDQFKLKAKVSDYFNPPLDKIISKTTDIFGTYADLENYELIKKINDNDSEVIEKLNLKKGGNDGLRELQERFVDFKKEIISEDFNPEKLLSENNSLYLSFFKLYVRYEEAEWGFKSSESFQNIFDEYKKYKNSDKFKDLNSNFKPSKEISINRSDEEARESYKFNEHFLNRFSVLVNSIKKAKSLYQEKYPLRFVVDQIDKKRISLIYELRNKVEKMPNPQAKEGINRKINLLESVNLRSVKDFQENFSILASNKEFNELLRQVVFLISFSKNKQSLEFDLNNIDLKRPQLSDISWILNFIDHISNQEVMSKYFTSDKAKKMFENITSTKAIGDELVLLQGEGDKSSGKTKIKFIPTRSILMEFSGHIADACWASKYDSIAKNFPNFSSVIIIQNPNNKYERLAGAFMLIETESKEGEKLLVIRGFNPIENLINSLSVKDFFNKTIKYLKDLAEKDQRKLAIVIDGKSGGSATNRMVLASHLDEIVKKVKPVELKSDKDTTFNGPSHNIVNNTYLLS